MRAIKPGDIPVRDFHQFLLGSVAPRPIAFVSTVDEKGNANLAPYSFFNAFSSNPPTLVFSSNRRVKDNTTKDTLHNVRESGECVINVVTYDIVRQSAVTSVEFEPGVSEFEKSGLTPIKSELVKPYRVKESPVQMECKVKEIITLGEHGGAGHLVICDVLMMHVAERIIDEKGRIDPHKIDLMGRMGRAYYVRASGTAIHTIIQEVTQMVIGYDALPAAIRSSHILSANHLGLLAGLHKMPDAQEIEAFVAKDELDITDQDALHRAAAELLDKGEREKAMTILMAGK